MFASIAYAAAGAPGGAAGAGAQGGLLQLAMPIILMFAVFYFLLIRPQQKRAKQHRAMLNALQKGDYVLTSGGLRPHRGSGKRYPYVGPGRFQGARAPRLHQRHL